MSPATCNADLMKITTDKWDALIPTGLKYDRYTSDGLDVLENWLKEMQSYVTIKRMHLEEMEEFEKEYDVRINNSPEHLKKAAE